MDVNTNPISMLVLLILCLFLRSHISLGADTISGNQSLSGNQTIVSEDGVFELGFFKPSNASKYYIGMWYKQITEKTVVWVANREKPVSDTYSSELQISDGNLVLFNESKVPIWSTNVNSTRSPEVKAILLNDGNLVLEDGSNSSKRLWESFLNPAHTWLPGSRIGYNKKTNTKQLLTSWKSSEDPAPGLYSLEIVPNGKSYIIRWNRSRQYWTSGDWNGAIFSKIPEMRLNYIYNFSFVPNDEETYFTYSVYPSSRTISRFVMDVSGQIKQLSLLSDNKWNLFWAQPRQQCEVYVFCGAYGSCSEKSLPFCHCLTGFEPKMKSDWDLQDYSGGCTRKTKLQCGNDNPTNGERDGFRKTPNVLLSEIEQPVQVGNTTACESTCLNNCSCTAYAYDNSGCMIWMGDLLNVQQLEEDDNRGRMLYIRVAASELKSSTNEFKSTKSRKGLIVGVVAGSIFLLGLILFFILRRRNKVFGTGKVKGALVAFGYRDLQNATKNFSEKLGGGGFGSVFKGTLPDSTMIAVKKLESVGQGEKQFRTEVSTIGSIQHVNLVRLHGFCSQGTKRLLVYGYMSNGSLDAHLFHEKNSNVLVWETRYRIALGIARGLVYLHEKCRNCIIHCDIKPENILLDDEFCPKVADFGLAKLMGRDFSRVLTTMRGTRGYLAPEWIAGVAITSKADVYSYGMMLFELVSGRRNAEQSKDGKVNFFPTLATSILVEGGNVLSLLDPRLDGNADIEELERVSKVACWCIQDEESHRPSMGQVVQILEGIMEVNLPPVPGSLKLYVDNKESIIFFTESESNESSSSTSSQAKGTNSSICASS
ncbi:G-type lectin S-receptor-like serine/threonine-protein kinase At2g19130 [Morus notabilis]|uniref:G-type lectin S-receptor-like serine/threonine-protein kinase At2g19130 n=1 Tax=Morus notabilis TaxID=981085 RepID=UPI000CECFF60|nr:G-type lectin S-receptor-like serine/threonine-protein kinase At2g19130 [Morus notabilis]